MVIVVSNDQNPRQGRGLLKLFNHLTSSSEYTGALKAFNGQTTGLQQENRKFSVFVTEASTDCNSLLKMRHDDVLNPEVLNFSC